MPELEINIGDRQIIVTDPETIPISIDYSLEDVEDFQQKKSSQALNITVPATLINQQAANSLQNPTVLDLSEGSVFRNPQRANIIAKGQEVFTGKALLQEATHTDKPEDYIWNLFGDNADWMMDLADSTFFDFLNHIAFAYDKTEIVNSWQFDGTNESLPYVFAPIRYREPMGVRGTSGKYDDKNMLVGYMKPSLSKYWIIYWAFKSIGYRVSSEFFDTDFFRRQTMPWTWGNFLYSDGTRLDNLLFLAKAYEAFTIDSDFDGYGDYMVRNDFENGAFDNNNVYTYDGVLREMQWTYLPQFNYGLLEAHFHVAISVDVKVTREGESTMWVNWYKRNASGFVSLGADVVFDITAPLIGNRTVIDFLHIYRAIDVNPGDMIIAKIGIHNNKFHQTAIFPGEARITASIDTFELEYFRVVPGSTIDFKNFLSLKKYKILDYLRGIVDEFNLSIKTDVINKIVLMEPTHPYVLPGETNQRPGFFNNDFIDWSQKMDVSKKGSMRLFNDHEKELFFKYKNDTGDGIQKKIQDRYTITLAQGKYTLPERFKAGKKQYENRFFSATMHFEVAQWKDITGTTPQMICMIPENVSNTSNAESENTFLPKSCYYKGIVPGLGWVFDGEERTAFPMMFAVNYMPGGENDPVLSYSDERIGPEATGTVAHGLLKLFFWQRLANIRNGQWHTSYFKLNNTDVSKPWHREFKTYLNQKWELIDINGFQPMRDETTKCVLRKWSPVLRIDNDNTYPSEDSVLNNIQSNSLDIKYSPLKCLFSDIKK